MCRLSAFTTTEISPIMRRLFWNQLMLVSNAENQKHGAGMTDGVSLFKSVSPYMLYGSQWVKDLDPNAIWLGHVRAASPNTEITSYTAHPFAFDLPNGMRLFAAHNGGITDMEIKKGEPRVDSLPAFKLLVDALREEDELTPEIINEWTAKFGKQSEWTFMFHYKKQLTVVRGIRTMFYMTFNDGFMLNTSFNVLLNMKEWLHDYWHKQYTVGKIEEIREYQMTTLDLGSTIMELQPINKPEPEEDVLGTYFIQKATDIVGKLTKR